MNAKNKAGQDWWGAEGRRERLIELWADPSYTAAQIGAILGCTKNAVIGLANRMELPLRRAKAAEAATKKESYPYLNLGANDCRWPIGHPPDDNFHFCGKAIVPEKSYCSTHYKLSRIKETKPASQST